MNNGHELSVSLEALLPLLAERLYSDAGVFVRELVCNSFDAIQRRRALPEQNDAPRQIALHVSGDDTIVVEDTGIGMTEDEMHLFLGCVGMSATRACRARGDAVIGQFGVGFLSVMAVAEWVRIETRSAIEPQQPHVWSWKGGIDYQLNPLERTTTGTAITVRLQSRFREFADVSRLRELVEYHVPYLPVPIQVKPFSDAREPSPWADLTAPGDVKRGLNAHTFSQLPNDCLHIFTTAWPGGCALLGFHGTSLQGTGRLTIYQHGVLVDADNTSLLPKNWRFVSGAVETTAINLQLDRGDIRNDDSLCRLQEQLQDCLRAELVHLGTNDPPLFRTLLAKHRSWIAALLEEDPALLSVIGPSYPFATTVGPQPFRDILEMATADDTARTIYFITAPPQSELRWSAARAAGRLVIWCRDPTEVRLLCALAERDGIVEVSELTWHLAVEPTEGTSALPPRLRRWLGRLQELFGEHGIAIEAMHLEPPSVPAIAQLPDLPTADGHRDDGPTSETARVIESFLGALLGPPEPDEALGRLIVNQLSPVVTNLAHLPESRCPLALSASLLLTTGVVQSGLAIPEAWLPSLEQLVADGSHSLTVSEHGVEESPHTMCFFAHAFKRQRHVLSRLRALLEHSPYYWEVRSAIDLQADNMLYENVYTQIAQSHVIIADLSDRNPNVLLELGLALGLKDQSEIIMIADRRLFRPFSDISGRLVHLYDSSRLGGPSKSFGQHLHAYLTSVPDYRYARKRYPFLGYRLLSEQKILSAREVSMLRTECADPIEFLAAPNDQLSRNTGILPRKIARARDYFSERIRQHQRDVDLFEASFSHE